MPASSTLDVRVFASADAALSDDDVDLGLAPARLNVRLDATRTLRLRVAVPPTLSAGNYRLIAVIDAASVIPERDEANNVVASTSDSVILL